jgi:hypothetical protein
MNACFSVLLVYFKIVAAPLTGSNSPTVFDGVPLGDKSHLRSAGDGQQLPHVEDSIPLDDKSHSHSAGDKQDALRHGCDISISAS